MKKTSIGGEALIEGVLMRGPKSYAAAYRQTDGSIIVEKEDHLPLGKRYKVLGIPFIRGVAGLIESLIIGVRALMRSAEMIEIEEEEEPGWFERFLDRLFGDKLKDAAIIFSMVLALGLGVVLFMIFPNLVASGVEGLGVRSKIWLNVIEGVIRLITFFAYILLISRMKDIRRVFEYHGAEHKTIYAYENEEELTFENIEKHSTRHPRCGTAFLFFVILVSIVVFSFIGWHTIIVNVLFRLLLVPVVAGISYELLKLAGRTDNSIIRFISYPGVFLQRFTTREPDAGQIEVAVAALNSVIEDIEEGEDEVG